MKLNLRGKTIAVILSTSLLALLAAGVFINAQVRRDFDRFLDKQVVFIQGRIPQFPEVREMMREKPHTLLEEEFEDNIWRGITVAGLLATGVAVIAGVYFAQRITSPLERLKCQISKLKKHVYNEPVTYEGDDEIGELAAAFEELREELHRVEELRKDVVSDMAHELTTPLQALLGLVEGVEEGVYRSGEKTVEMKQAIEQIRLLVDDMRMFSHARAKQREVIWQEIKIGDFVDRELGSLFQQAREKGLKVEMQIEDNLELKADRKMLGHILDNLVKNAIQFTEQGTISLNIGIKGDGYGIVVADTGIGISEGDLPYIFERFYRADKSRSKETGGTGLGLSIVKEYIDQLGWSIEVESKAGKGSRFIITI